MRKGNRGFTLAELLVVITILAIISVTAYTSFSGSTDKARNSTKLNHLASIEGALNMYFQDNNHYPMPSASGTNNVWGYDNTQVATLNNTLALTLDGSEIASITSGSGGGRVYLSGTTSTQIGAKGVVDETVLGKKYLSQLLFDPSLKDIKVGNDKTFSDFGIGKYVYGVYAKNNTLWTAASKKGKGYNLAITLLDEQKGYVTKLAGNFDASMCINCPDSLIGSGTLSLIDGDTSMTGSYADANERIPYPIDGF